MTEIICRTNLMIYGWLVSASIECWLYPSEISYELYRMVKRSLAEHRKICKICQGHMREMSQLEREMISQLERKMINAGS